MPEPQSQESDIDLAHYLELALRRRWIILSATLLVALVTGAITFTTRPMFQSSALLVIEKERGGAMFSNGAMVENSNDDYYQTQYRLLRSYSLLEKVHAQLHLDQFDEFSNPNGVEKLQDSVSIVPVAKSRLLNVRAESYDPGLSARIANGISQAFVQQNLENQLFISKEVLQALQVNNNDADARARYDSLPAVVNNALIQSLKGEYAKLESQVSALSQIVTPKHPTLISLRSNLDTLRKQIDGETDKIVQSLKTELSGQLRGNNVRIVDAARVPERPFKPKKAQALVLGLIGGLTVGLSLALMVENLDQSIRSQDDVEAKLSLPFLGLIPHSSVIKEHVYESLLAQEPSLTGEAFRNLRTMVDFAGVSLKSKALFVTSSVQEEGKTFVASNLAVTFAQMGENVLLIDGDLRRPSVHKNFHLSSESGLSDYLASSHNVAEVSALIRKSQVSNLSVLSCGPRPPNPSELLNTPRLAALLVWARTNFDRVVVDCTPMFPINDTLLWGRHIDSAVFVVRYGKTRVPLIKNATQRLLGAGTRLLGVAINGAQAGGLAYAAYGYYYQQYYRAYHPAPSAKT